MLYFEQDILKDVLRSRHLKGKQEEAGKKKVKVMLYHLSHGHP